MSKLKFKYTGVDQGIQYYPANVYMKGKFPDRSDISTNLNLLKFYCSKKHQDSFIKIADHSEIDLFMEDNELAKIAITFNCDIILKYLIDKGLNIKCSDNYLIKLAAYNGNCDSLDVLKILIDHGADLTVDNNFPIKHAVQNCEYENVKILIESGVDPSFNDNEIFDYFISKKLNFETLKILVDNGVDPLINNEYIFNISVCSGNYKMIKLFIDSGADLKLLSNDTLFNCLRSKSYESIQLLIDNNIDFSFINDYEISKIQISAESKIYNSLSNSNINFEKLVTIITEHDVDTYLEGSTTCYKFRNYEY